MNIKDILNEEVDRQIEVLNMKDPKSLKKVLTELFTFSTDNFLKNIGSQETILDEKESLPEENWEWLMQTIQQSYNEVKEDWIAELKKQKMKILCFKYFTKQELTSVEELEKKLKLDVKKYFTALQNFTDLDNFKDKFFNLPNLTLTDFVRYIFSRAPDLEHSLKITKEELKKEVAKLKENRQKTFDKISLVSKGYQSTLDLAEIKDLFDKGLFFEDNILNRAMAEYFYKLANNKVSAENIKKFFNSSFLYDLKTQTEVSPSYVKHIDSIKKETGKPYFTDKGMQIGTRFDNEVDIVKNKKYGDDYVIDPKSRFKEPTEKIESVTPAWQKSEDTSSEEGTDSDSSTGGGSGSSSGGSTGGAAPGGGGITFEPPDVDPNALDGDEEGLGTDDLIGGDNPGADDTGESEDSNELPTGDDGLPVDFGTKDTNPDADKKEKPSK